MLNLGYSRVGSAFPVFLHPETGEEYALARRERSTGPGYNDFEVEFSPDVTIEEDLVRRDFTMNAIAQDMETGGYIDPFNGIGDINQRIICHVHERSFAEDPVRVLRLARFSAKFPSFRIAENTKLNACHSGNLHNATAERVGLELSKALMTVKPSNFFDTLFTEIGIRNNWFSEIFDLRNVPQPIKWHAEGDAYTHTMMVLNSAAKHNAPLEVRLGCLLHDVGKATTKDTWPSHPAHEIRGVPLAEAFCDRLKLSNDLKKAAVMATKHHGHVHKAFELNPKTYIKIYEDIKSNALYLAEIISQVAFHDNEGKLPYEAYTEQDRFFMDGIKELTEVKLSTYYSQNEIDQMSIDKRKQMLHKLRLLSLE